MASSRCSKTCAALGFPPSCTSTANRPRFRVRSTSAYRIVQEGLTNALKHARASHADVTLRYRPDELELQVLDNGAGTVTTNGLGHGLVGIRERVKIYGGEMSAGAAPAGGFILTARLPVDRHQS